MSILAVAFGTSKTLVWKTNEVVVQQVVADLRNGVPWNTARKPLGDDYVATNSVDAVIRAEAERLSIDCDYFLDLENLSESLAEID